MTFETPLGAAPTTYRSMASSITSTNDTEKQGLSGSEAAPDHAQDPVSTVTTHEKDARHEGQTLSNVDSATTSIHRTETRQDGSNYPEGLKLALIIVALCFAVFLMCLDNAIIATAIPKITDEFNSLDDIGWYGSGTLLQSHSQPPDSFPLLGMLLP